jgi:glycosyltransferase involved in cell wall biosynthesis
MRVLHAIHDYLPRHRGGSELYAHALCRAQQPRHDVRVLCAGYDARRPHGSVVERRHEGVPVSELVNNWSFPSFTDSWRPAGLRPALLEVLEDFTPDVLHVHSLLNLSFDLPELARTRGAAVVATLHDYTLVCASGGQRIHLAEEHLCREIEHERCARCFGETPWWRQLAVHAGDARPLRRLLRRIGATALEPPSERELATRLEAARALLDQAFDLIVAPSPSLAAEFRRLGAPADRLRVSDYGLPPFPAAARRPRGAVLRLGFAGTPTWHKGVHVLLDAVSRLPEGGWSLDVWGDLGVAPEYSRRLREQAAGLPVLFRGAFEREQIAEVYAGMDVLVVPSLWLENSPLVVHEAFLAGVPVVAARLGGLADLVEHERSGLLYEATSAGELALALRRLLGEPGLLDRLAARPPEVKGIEQDAACWDGFYAEARARRGGDRS